MLKFPQAQMNQVQRLGTHERKANLHGTKLQFQACNLQTDHTCPLQVMSCWPAPAGKLLASWQGSVLARHHVGKSGFQLVKWRKPILSCPSLVYHQKLLLTQNAQRETPTTYQLKPETFRQVERTNTPLAHFSMRCKAHSYHCLSGH